MVADAPIDNTVAACHGKVTARSPGVLNGNIGMTLNGGTPPATDNTLNIV